MSNAAALVERFGPALLAVPEDEGFGLTAYLVPVLAGLLGLGAKRLDRELAARERRAVRAVGAIGSIVH